MQNVPMIMCQDLVPERSTIRRKAECKLQQVAERKPLHPTNWNSCNKSLNAPVSSQCSCYSLLKALNVTQYAQDINPPLPDLWHRWLHCAMMKQRIASSKK